MKPFYLIERASDKRVILVAEKQPKDHVIEEVHAASWLGAYKALKLDEKKHFYKRDAGHGYFN